MANFCLFLSNIICLLYVTLCMIRRVYFSTADWLHFAKELLMFSLQYVVVLVVFLFISNFGFNDKIMVRILPVPIHSFLFYITQTRPCNIQQYFTAALKMLIFR